MNRKIEVREGENMAQAERPRTITHGERFRAVMNYRPFDRVPLYYFGTWPETLERWQAEGLSSEEAIPAETGLDPDWEAGMWTCHGLIHNFVLTDIAEEVLEETEDYRVVRTPLGAVHQIGKHGSSIPKHLKEALEPTREDWNRFKRYLDPEDPRRWWEGWEEKATALNEQDRALAIVGGSLFGFVRDWMGVEAFSTLPYTDPVLYEDILEHMTDFFIGIYGPVVERVSFDFIYFFEDCCFNHGPLISPDIFDRYYKKRYRRLTDFYRSKGADKILLDSDGNVELLIPHWLDAGIDIVFPVEVGTWRADPVELRRKFGRDLRMMGGVDKHIIPRGEAVVRAELERLRPLVEEGGYIPLPDHRIPPECSLEQFRSYVRVFKEVFGFE